MTFISAMQTTRSMSSQLSGKACDDRRVRDVAMLAFFREGRRFVDLAADDVAGDDDDDAEQERDRASPRR